MSSEGPTVNAGETEALERFLQGEISGLHERYLAARQEIVEICHACQISPRSATARVMPVAAVVIAIPTYLMLRHN